MLPLPRVLNRSILKKVKTDFYQVEQVEFSEFLSLWGKGDIGNKKLTLALFEAIGIQYR